MTKRVLIVDALNAFYRSYIVDPSRSTNGQPIGGIKGFLKILQRLIRETNPVDEVVICWDGPGGSLRRKQMNKNYKDGRTPIRANWDIKSMSPQDELENKIWQQARLMEYLNLLPVVQLVLPEVEADDVISYVAQHPKYKDWQKIIVSSDKDFLQLCAESTIVMRPKPNKKSQQQPPELLNSKRVVEKYGIHPTNFALARAIAGDKSDNLPGVDGVGLPTVAKRFEFLQDSETYTIADVLEYCQNTESKVKAYQNILEQQDRVIDNYKMMQLYSPQISVSGKRKLRETVETFSPSFNKTGFLTMMIKDGFGESNWSVLFRTSKRITLDI